MYKRNYELRHDYDRRFDINETTKPRMRKK